MWNRYGFAWGGNYNAPTVPDAMHHEFMGTPAQCVAATNLARTELGGTSAQANDGILESGDSGWEVTKLQNALNAHGVAVTVDGSFGPATKAAVVSFQSAHGLTADGVVGDSTATALGIAPLAKIQNAIKTFYDGHPDIAAAIGLALTPELSVGDGRGYYNNFENGSIYWTATTGAQMVKGAIRQKWYELSAQAGRLGYPTGSETAIGDGRGYVNTFEGGSVYWTAATGAHPVWGGIGQVWVAKGAQGSTLGYPTDDEAWNTDHWEQHFEHGVIRWFPDNHYDFGGGSLPPAKNSPVTGNPEVPGFDCSYTRVEQNAMHAAGYTFMIGYVSPTAGKNLTHQDMTNYLAAGIAVGLVWEGSAGEALNGAAAGSAAGASAEAQANALGYPANAVIFFAVDVDTTSASYAAIQAYANAFNAATTRPVGIYGEADVIDHFVTPGVQPVQYGWQTAAWSGGRLSAKANLYQRVGHPSWPVPAGVSSTAFDEDVALRYLPLAGWL
jgi:peptidoglycan hydrolase-like protein with peptidoglycan-binding domain